PHDRHIASVVSRRRFLLERVLVLLVDDNEAEFARRREDSTACPDDDLNVPGRDPPPVSAAFGVGEVAVQDGDVPAAALEARDRLRRERDLRNEDDRFLPLLHRLLDSSEINLRLSAARHAMQQERLERTRPGERRTDLLPYANLIGVEVDFRRA